MKLLIFIGTTFGSYAGWALCEWLGGGIFESFIVSSIGAAVGIYAGWKIAKNIEQ